MKLNESLLLKLSRKYTPSTMVAMKFRGKDLNFRTDADGNPVSLFIGHAKPDGKISGERFVRTMIRDAGGNLIKDYWDRKGRT